MLKFTDKTDTIQEAVFELDQWPTTIFTIQLEKHGVHMPGHSNFSAYSFTLLAETNEGSIVLSCIPYVHKEITGRQYRSYKTMLAHAQALESNKLSKFSKRINEWLSSLGQGT